MNFAALAAAPANRRRSIVITVLAGALLVGLLATLAPARPSEQRRVDHRIAVGVTHLLNSLHLSDMRVDDEVSQRTLKRFLEMIDPYKRYLFQSDVDEFYVERDHIDDYVRRGDVRLGKRIFDRFLLRVDERIEVAHRLLDQPHDFTLDEDIIRDPEKMAYATTEVEADERWRKRVKFDLLTHTTDDMEYEEAVEKLHKRYRSIRTRWGQTDNDELLEFYLTALTTSFDPHSNYMSPSSLENFTILMSLELNGIGASLQSEFGETTVRELVPGGAAEKDGRLAIGDIITGVAQGADGELVDIIDMKINDVVHLIRGDPGTIVRLEVSPEDGTGRKIYDVTRARIELKDKEARGTVLREGSNGSYFPDPTDQAANAVEESVDQEEAPELDLQARAHSDQTGTATGQVVEQEVSGDGPSYRIGVISLPSFYLDIQGRRNGRPDYKSTTADVRRLLEDFKTQQVDLVIMDLRFNGGGSLLESVDTTGLFIDQGPVVMVKGPTGQVNPHPDEEPGMVWSGPLVVLINKFSASASEIFAGAIQDYGRGIVVGDHSTHGKGTVQQLSDLGRQLMPIHGGENLGALKLTIQQFYRPSGDSTQKRGVLSDVELPALTTHLKGIGESELDYALEFDRVKPQKHINYHGANAQVIHELQQRSAERSEASEYFTAERRKIERYLERRERPVTLNKEEYLAELAEVNTEKEQEDLFESMRNEDRPVFPENKYNEEVLDIARDYLELLGDNPVAAVVR